MARVTAEEVEAIIKLDANVVSTLEVDSFILPATALTDRVAANDSASVMTAALLKEVERWLAAHFCAISDVRSSKEEGDEVRQDFQYKVDLGFNQTQYGQQALMLDLTGTLADLQAQSKGGLKASLETLNPTATTPVVD